MDFLTYLLTSEPDVAINDFLDMLWLSIVNNPKTWSIIAAVVYYVVTRTPWAWDDKLWERIKSWFTRGGAKK